MRKICQKWYVLIAAVFGILILNFQNCGPAKLTGSVDNGSNQLSSIGHAVGSKVDLSSLLQAPKENPANVLHPAQTANYAQDYARSSPILENLVLLNNDFHRIEWVHGPSSTVVAEGEDFNQILFNPDMVGTYYVFGYRGHTVYQITQLNIINKTSSTIGVNTEGAVTVSQKVIDPNSLGQPIPNFDPANELILFRVESPGVDLMSSQMTLSPSGQIFEGRRVVLIKKKINEAVSMTLKLSDLPGNNRTLPINFPAKQLPSPAPTPNPAPAPAPAPNPAPAPAPAPAPQPQPAPAPQPAPQPQPAPAPAPAPQPQPTGRDAFVRIEAESADVITGVTKTTTSVGSLDHGDSISFQNVNFGTGAISIELGVAVPASNAGQKIEVHLDSVTGPLIASHTVLSTGGWDTFAAQSSPLSSSITGTRNVFLRFVGTRGIGNLDYVRFSKTSVPAQNLGPVNAVHPLEGGTITVTGTTASINFRILNTSPLSENFMGFIQITNLDGTHNYTSHDYSPTPGTSQWSGTMTFNQVIEVPTSIPNGEYPIRVGFFMNRTPWTRVDLNVGSGVTEDDQIRFIIGRIRVQR